MEFAVSKETLFTLVIALITWFGVFAYLLRLDLLTRALEKRTRETEGGGMKDEG